MEMDEKLYSDPILLTTIYCFLVHVPNEVRVQRVGSQACFTWELLLAQVASYGGIK